MCMTRITLTIVLISFLCLIISEWVVDQSLSRVWRGGGVVVAAINYAILSTYGRRTDLSISPLRAQHGAGSDASSGGFGWVGVKIAPYFFDWVGPYLIS
jgi:hypothetical protein